MTDRIDFVCVRPDHQVTTLAEALTIHDEKWAYCRSGTDRQARVASMWRHGPGQSELQRYPVTRFAYMGQREPAPAASPDRVTTCSPPRSSMAAVNAMIEHLCAKQEHQLPEDVASPVIAYADRWGYCPAGAAEGHDWRATGGRTLATVREWLGRPSTVGRDKESNAPETTVRR